MRAEFLRDGLFRSSKLFYAWKVASNFTILGAALVLLSLAETSWLSFVLSACLLATFWQQSGWLAHDFLHHQVWADRHWNKAWGYFLGNVSQVSLRTARPTACTHQALVQFTRTGTPGMTGGERLGAGIFS